MYLETINGRLLQRTDRMISKNLKRFRAEKGLTQKSLAKISGVSEQQISRYEKGLMTPNAKALKNLSQALKKSIAELEDDPSQSSNNSTSRPINRDPEVLKKCLSQILETDLSDLEFEALRYLLEAFRMKKDLQKYQN